MKAKINLAKNLLGKQGKKKIVRIIIPIVGPYLLMTIMGLLVVLMVASPVMNAVEKIADFTDKVGDFFEKTGNWLTLRGFQIIDQEAVEGQEEKIAEKLNEEYERYLPHHVTLDAPLIAATIYYPMTNVYDEESMQNLFGSIDEEADTEGNYKKYFDYMKKASKDIKELARHSVSEYVYTYSCKAVNTTNADGDPITVYVRDQLTKTEGPREFDGSFGGNTTCKSATGSMIEYVYVSDPERYDNYLKDYYIDDNDFYDVPTNLSGEAKEDWYQQTVYEIHYLAKLYGDILIDKEVYANTYSAFCPTGVVVTGDDAGVYPLEEYIAGVVQHENNFQDPKDPNNIEAMKAQAIAARTYLLKYTDNCKKSIVNSESAQTFYKNASDRAKRAAGETAGMVLTYDGEIFLSEYDSFDCSNLCISGLDCSCEYYKLPHLTATGKVTWDNTSAINKHIISIPSDFIKNNIGGHGRGMSQWGANYLQTQGKTYEEILKYFYAEGVQIATAGGSESGTDGSVVVENGIFYIPSNSLSGRSGSKGTGPSGFNIVFWNRLQNFFNAAESAGFKIGYTDAWRSYEAQEACKIEKPTLCATPGKSMHGWGIAADLNYYGNRKAKDWAHANATTFGLKYTVCRSYPNDCKEDWHIEPLERKYR